MCPPNLLPQWPFILHPLPCVPGCLSVACVHRSKNSCFVFPCDSQPRCSFHYCVAQLSLDLGNGEERGVGSPSLPITIPRPGGRGWGHSLGEAESSVLWSEQDARGAPVPGPREPDTALLPPPHPVPSRTTYSVSASGHGTLPRPVAAAHRGAGWAAGPALA